MDARQSEKIAAASPCPMFTSLRILLRLTFVPLLMILPLSGKELGRLPLAKSGFLVLSEENMEGRVIYQLSIQSEDGLNDVFWRRELPAVQFGREFQECRLDACDERDGSIAVMMNLSQFTWMLVQYQPTIRKVEQHQIRGDVFLSKLSSMEEMKLIAPNRFELKEYSGNIVTYFFTDGQIVDEAGVPTDPVTRFAPINLNPAKTEKTHDLDPAPPDPPSVDVKKSSAPVKELSRLPLAKSGFLVLSETWIDGQAIYQLSTSAADGTIHIFWQRGALPAVQLGPEVQGCGLETCDERGGTIAVMLNLSYFTRMLVEYAPGNKKVRQHEIRGGVFLNKLRNVANQCHRTGPISTEGI